MAVDNKKIAEDVLAAVGGASNVTNATHCMTRLRLNLKDQSIPNDDEVKQIKGVLGAQWSGGQYQVIIGQNVPKVYDAAIALGVKGEFNHTEREWADEASLYERTKLLMTFLCEL